MIDLKDFIIKVARNGDKKRFYKACCDACGANRGYKLRKYANILCKSCGLKSKTDFPDNVNRYDHIVLPDPVKLAPGRQSYLYRTICIYCKQDKGHVRTKDFLKPCLSCAAKRRHQTMSKKTKKNARIKISCAQRNITTDKFDQFTTPINEKERATFKTSEARKQCFERSNYTCKIYGLRGASLHAHHLESWHHNEALRYDIDNLVCLSEEAHRTFHHLFGNKHNTKQQFEDFEHSIKKMRLIKPIVYLVSGPPASGKSWICKQLADHYNYVSYDENKKNLHAYLLLKGQRRPSLYDPIIGVSTFIKKFGHLFDIKLLVIQEKRTLIEDRMLKRGGKITPTIERRIKRMKSLAKNAVFSGTSQEALNYLNTKIQF